MEAASLVVHIAAGSLAVLAGYVAIFAAKGAGLHRRSGMVFASAMIVMGMTGLAVAIFRDLPGSLGGGPLAAYFVITGVTTVRPIDRRLDIAMLVVALSTSVLGFGLVANAVAQGRSTIDGVPHPMRLLFAVVTLLCALSDIRLLRGAVSVGPVVSRAICGACASASGSRRDPSFSVRWTSSRPGCSSPRFWRFPRCCRWR